MLILSACVLYCPAGASEEGGEEDEEEEDEEEDEDEDDLTEAEKRARALDKFK